VALTRSTKQMMSTVADAVEAADPRDMARGLGWARVGVGAVLLAAPSLFARAFSTPLRTDTATAVRAAAVRDLAVGVGTVRAVGGDGDDEDVRRWVDAGVAMDAVDFLAMLRARGMRPLIRVSTMLTAAGATAVGAMLSRRLRG
jgi:hypothetical protein